MVSEVNQLASDLPRYQSTLRAKIQSLRGATAVTGTLERASEVLQALNSDLNMPKRGAPARATSTRAAPTPERTFQRRHSGGNSATQLQRSADARGHRHVAG